VAASRCFATPAIDCGRLTETKREGERERRPKNNHEKEKKKKKSSRIQKTAARSAGG